MIQADDFRRVTGCFATGVTVTTFPGDDPHGLTVNAFSSVSLDPPLVQVCIDNNTTSYDLLETEGVEAYCVNILASDQKELGEYFANMTDTDESPFETESTRIAETGAKIFEGSLGFVDCSIWKAVPAGDHTIYIGKVEECEILNPEKISLTFFKGEWGKLS